MNTHTEPYLLVGLANPKEQYRLTRHNVGQLLLEHAYDPDYQFDKYSNSLIEKRTIREKELCLMFPQSFMNHSGKSVASFLKHHDAYNLSRTIVVYDDLDLDFGTMKVSFGRGSGGHNGVRSLHKELGSQSFIRIRVGIAQQRNERTIKPPVLGNFSHEELSHIEEVLVPTFKMIVSTILKQGYEQAMTIYNGKQV